MMNMEDTGMMTVLDITNMVDMEMITRIMVMDTMVMTMGMEIMMDMKMMGTVAMAMMDMEDMTAIRTTKATVTRRTIMVAMVETITMVAGSTMEGGMVMVIMVDMEKIIMEVIMKGTEVETIIMMDTGMEVTMGMIE